MNLIVLPDSSWISAGARSRGLPLVPCESSYQYFLGLVTMRPQPFLSWRLEIRGTIFIYDAGADMADEKHLEILRFGVEAWNIWYNAAFRGFADLRGASLACADLAGVNLTGGKLQDVDLRYTDLEGADLRGVDFTGARLERANLRATRLGNAKGLTPAMLCRTDGDETTELPTGLEYPTHWRICREAECPALEASVALQ